MPQTESQHRQIESLRPSRERIFGFRSEPAANKNHHQHGNQGDGQDRGKSHGESFGPRQRTEHAPFLSFEKEDRQKRHQDNEQGKEDGRANLFCRAHQNASPLLFCQLGSRGSVCVNVFREVAVTVLDHNDGRVDQHAYGQCQTAK